MRSLVWMAVDHKTEFQAIVLANLDSLYNYARVLTGRSWEAEDLLQDALLRAFRSFASFDPTLSGKAWLFKIMKNAYIDRGRRERARAVDEEWMADPVPLSPDPEDLLTRSLTAEAVREAIRRLPPIWREVIELREIEGLSYQEIADVIGKPIGTVMSRLSRGRDLLRVSLQSARNERVQSSRDA
jgi:RNA polymerase sigma-70 factor (ECF subfamily)